MNFRILSLCEWINCSKWISEWTNVSNEYRCSGALPYIPWNRALSLVEGVLKFFRRNFKHIILHRDSIEIPLMEVVRYVMLHRFKYTWICLHIEMYTKIWRGCKRMWCIRRDLQGRWRIEASEGIHLVGRLRHIRITISLINKYSLT